MGDALPNGEVVIRDPSGRLHFLLPDGRWEEWDPSSGTRHPSGLDLYNIGTAGGGGFPSAPPGRVPLDFWRRVKKAWLTAGGGGDPGGGSSTDTEKKIPPVDDNLKPKTRPIVPLPVKTGTTTDTDKDGDPDKDPKKKTDETVARDKKAGKPGWLRPFFSRYHGLDILTLTDKEAADEIIDWDLFDLPIPVGQDLSNPLFVHQLAAQHQRFNGAGNPANANIPTMEQTAGQIEFMFATSGFRKGNMIYEQETQWTARGVDTEPALMPIDPARRATVFGGTENGVPWRNPQVNSSGAASDQLGFGDRDRRDASYGVNLTKQLFKQPDVAEALTAPQLQQPTPSPDFYSQMLKNVNTSNLFTANI